MTKNNQGLRMAISIACLVLVSISVGGFVGLGNYSMAICFGVVWLLVAPVAIKQIYDIKKLETASQGSGAKQLESVSP